MNKILVLIISSMVLSCGIKGKPQPPLKPVELGRGKTTYKGATQKLINENILSEDDDEDEVELNSKGKKNE